MPLKPKIASLEDVDEPLRGLYVERDGSFVLDVEDDGRMRALEHERNQRKAATSRLGELEAELARLREAPAPESKAEAKKEDDRIAALTRQVEALTKAVADKEAEAKKARFQSAEERHFAAVRKAAIDAGVREELADDFTVARLRSRYRFDEATDSFQPIDPATGSVIYGDEYATQPATPEQLVKRVLADKSAAPYLRPSSGPAIEGGASRSVNGRAVRDGMLVIPKSQATDHRAYVAAKEAAKKQGLGGVVIDPQS
jgi:hypothetical protein